MYVHADGCDGPDLGRGLTVVGLENGPDCVKFAAGQDKANTASTADLEQ